MKGTISMRHGSFQGRRNNQNRHRGPSSGPRTNNNNGGGNQRPHRNQVFDSNGPEMRVRGTAFQINEKYQALAKDAASSGDIILAENYLQHAEHYQRIINEFEPVQQHQPRYEENTEGEQPAASGEGEQPAVHVVRSKRPRPASESSDDGDLGLPSSILGASAEAANAG